MAIPGAASVIQIPYIHTGTVRANWNSGFATSGLPGADLFIYGLPGQWWRLSDAYLVLAAFNPGLLTDVTVRAYLNIAGAERTVMDEVWEPAFDGELVFIVWFFEVQIFGPLRVEVYSNAVGAWPAGDDGLAAPYEYRVKEW